jgi:hypothetical protein
MSRIVIVGWQPYRHLWADCLDNVGSLTSHNPIGLHGQLRVYLFTLVGLWATWLLKNLGIPFRTQIATVVRHRLYSTTCHNSYRYTPLEPVLEQPHAISLKHEVVLVHQTPRGRHAEPSVGSACMRVSVCLLRCTSLSLIVMADKCLPSRVTLLLQWSEVMTQLGPL